MAIENLFESIQRSMTPDIVEYKDKDIYIKSKSRDVSKAKLEKFLSAQNIPFNSVFKKSKSSSIEVLTLLNQNIDIVFKPIIQKGAGGLAFEKELAIDLQNFFNGADIDSDGIVHKDVVSALQKELKLKQSSKYQILAEGSKNQRRELQFSGSSITISNCTGETLTDLTIVNTDRPSEKLYLSLKMSSSYYTLSASIYKYFLDKSTQVSINKFFGFDGLQMGGFGKEYSCKTPKPSYSIVSANLANLLKQAVGSKVVIVHKKKQNDVLVKKIENSSTVTISGLSADSYVYPVPNVRKYANIKVKANIDGKDYKVDFQFRGTTAADTGPKYLRILLERL